MKTKRSYVILTLCSIACVSSCGTTVPEGRIPLPTKDSVPLEQPVRLDLSRVIGSPGGSPGQFLQPRGLSLDPEGNIYVADTGNDRIQKLDESGACLALKGGFGFDVEQFNEPRDICAGTGLDIYVADSENRRLQRYDRRFNYLSSSVSNPNLDESLQFGVIDGIDMSTSGDLYLADVEHDRILVLDTFGRPERSFGDTGYGRGRLQTPVSLTFDGKSSLYVCDSGNDRIALYDLFGNYQGSLGERMLRSPGGIAIDARGYLYVADTGNHRIAVFDSNGRLLFTHGSQGDGPGSFRYPQDVAVDRRGYLYVLDSGSGRIQKFSIHYQ